MIHMLVRVLIDGSMVEVRHVCLYAMTYSIHFACACFHSSLFSSSPPPFLSTEDEESNHEDEGALGGSRNRTHAARVVSVVPEEAVLAVVQRQLGVVPEITVRR